MSFQTRDEDVHICHAQIGNKKYQVYVIFREKQCFLLLDRQSRAINATTINQCIRDVETTPEYAKLTQSLAANVDTFVDWKNNVLFGESFSVVSQSALKEQYKFILLI